MESRRLACLALAVAAAACQESIANNQNDPNSSSSKPVAVAVSFPSSLDATQNFQPPIPNDQVLLAVTCTPGAPGCTSPATPPPAVQVKLLQAFAGAGGWPNDQEVPIQVQFFSPKPGANGAPGIDPTRPVIDTTTITPSTLALVRIDGATPAKIDFDVSPSDYDATTGVLTIHKKPDPATGTRWWPTGPGGGRYVVALRGGSSGVKATNGQPIAPQSSALLLTRDKNITDPENKILLQSLAAQGANPDAVAAQLEGLRQLYANPVGWVFVPGTGAGKGWVPGPAPAGAVSALAAIDTVFPHQEAATLQTFVVDPSAHVAIDPNSSVVPLPSSLLMDAQSYFTNPLASHPAVPAVGALAPLAPGLNTLDGFSTTAMLLVPLSGTPVKASTVTGANVALLKKSGGAWTKVADFASSPAPGERYVLEPPQITIDTATGKPCAGPPFGATCVAPLIGLQPAVGVPDGTGGIVPLAPLLEHTEYAVIVTKNVTDAAGKPVTPGTIQKILGLAAPIALGGQGLPLTQSGKSLLAGVSDANAAQLQALAPAAANELATDLIPAALSNGVGAAPSDIVTAYSFVTQSITATAQQLAATPAAAGLPASLLDATGTPGTSAAIAPDVIAKKYGIPTTPLRNPAPPNNFVPKHFLEASLVTLDVLDPATGAFLPPAKQASAAPTPIPVLIAVPQDAAVTAIGGAAPVVVFRHGINGTRAQLLTLAATFTGAGMVVVAIDAPKFGDRSWCTTDADCASGSTCDHTKFGNQGDPASAAPGLCTGGKLAHVPLQSSLPACSATVTTECWDGTGGNAKSSGAFFVSGNLFRIRDSMRQDILDESALVRAFRGTPFAAGTMPALAASTFYVGHSLGAINGMSTLAVNTAFTRAALANGGGTFTDIASDSPAFIPVLDALVQSEGIQPGSAAFLQFLQVAKWVIDPADPINFAAPLAARAIPLLGLGSRCDNVVPNKENQLFYGLLGKTPTNPTATANNATMQWYMQDSTTACPTDGTIGQGASHGTLLDFANQSLTVKAQTNAATFLLSGASTVTTPVLP